MRGKKFLKSAGSLYTPPNQLAYDTSDTPGICWSCWRHEYGSGNMKETDCRVIILFSPDDSTPADQAVTIVRMKPNDITAMDTPRIVSSVRSLCRSVFFSTSLMMNMESLRWSVRPCQGASACAPSPPHADRV